jgi:membrane protein DedA with SNARE-associated domain
MVLLCLAVLSGLLVGYLVGRYVGKKRGIKQGTARAPLFWRQKSLQQGRCLLCHSRLDNLSLKQENSELSRNNACR